MRVSTPTSSDRNGTPARPRPRRSASSATSRKSRTKDSLKAFDKLTRLVDGEPRIISDPPLIVPINDLLDPDQAQAFVDAIRAILRSYRRSLPADRRLLLERFRYVDCARKVVGVGSVGTRAWVVLMIGKDGDDPLFLQIKQAEASVLEPFLGKSKFANHGQRVVEGQRLMQTASDILLGWFRSPGIDGVTRDFYIRQLWDGKTSALVETMPQRGLRVYAKLVPRPWRGPTPAPGTPSPSPPTSAARTPSTVALASFAETYADQNERDFAALREAVTTGRVVAHKVDGRHGSGFVRCGDLGVQVPLSRRRARPSRPRDHATRTRRRPPPPPPRSDPPHTPSTKSSPAPPDQDRTYGQGSSTYPRSGYPTGPPTRCSHPPRTPPRSPCSAPPTPFPRSHSRVPTSG